MSPDRGDWDPIRDLGIPLLAILVIVGLVLLLDPSLLKP